MITDPFLVKFLLFLAYSFFLGGYKILMILDSFIPARPEHIGYFENPWSFTDDCTFKENDPVSTKCVDYKSDDSSNFFEFMSDKYNVDENNANISSSNIETAHIDLAYIDHAHIGIAEVPAEFYIISSTDLIFFCLMLGFILLTMFGVFYFFLFKLSKRN